MPVCTDSYTPRWMQDTFVATICGWIYCVSTNALPMTDGFKLKIWQIFTETPKLCLSCLVDALLRRGLSIRRRGLTGRGRYKSRRSTRKLLRCLVRKAYLTLRLIPRVLFQALE